MFDDEWYFSEKFTREQAWIDLLLLAEYKPRKFYIRKNLVELERGQLAVSIRTLAERWKWGINKVQGFISELEESGRIDTQKSHVVNILTISKYEYYQVNDFIECASTDTQTDTQGKTDTQKVAKIDTQTDTQKQLKNQGLTEKNRRNSQKTDTQTDTQGKTDTQKVAKIDTQTDTQKQLKNQGLTEKNRRNSQKTDTQTDTPLRSIYGDTNVSPTFSNEKDSLLLAQAQEFQSLLEEVKLLRVKVEQMGTSSNPPAPEKPKRKRKAANPLIAPCREIFEGYYNEIYDAAYYWQAKDAVAMGSLISKITNSRKSKGKATEEEDIKSALSAMLHSVKDEWMLKNFSVTNIDSKYNEIVAQARRSTNGNQNETSTINRTDSARNSQARANDVAALITRLGSKNKPVEG